MDELISRPKAPAVALSLANLSALPVAISRPTYERSQLSAGILHIGIGNFHRAHMAVYLDQLFEQGKGHDWAIVGAGVTPFDATQRERLKVQDYLTTVIEQDAVSANARITGAMVDFIDPNDKAELILRLADPAIRIVSLTITEGGYFIDPITGRFDSSHPAVRQDGASPASPETVFGIILAGLVRRRAAKTAPFTVLSCDNVPHNGDVTRETLVGLAMLSDPALANWIKRNIAFPNSMVDRITPATGDRERALAAQDFGVTDASPVFCEPFKQWVLEDKFPSGRPALEAAGVTFVKDVTPWEIMKIRILNGGHAIIAYPAGLLGITFVDEAMAHPVVRAFLDKVETNEIIPQVPKVPGTELMEYYASVAHRFANPRVGDTIRRLCLDGSNRQPKFIVPTIADALRSSQSIAGLALCSALWCRYCLGITETGDAIAPNDPNWERLNETAQAAQTNPEAWLAMGDVYGETGQNPFFRAAFARALADLGSMGVLVTLARYLET